MALPAVTPIHSLLEAGELLTWEDQPDRQIQIRKSDLVMIPLSLVYAGFIGFISFGFIMADKRDYMMLSVLLPFMLIAAYVVVGRFYYDAYKRRRTWFAITSKRVLIVTKAPGLKVQSIPLTSIGGVAVDSYTDKLGTVLLKSKAVDSMSPYVGKLEFADHPSQISWDIELAIKNLENQQQPQQAG